MSASNAETIITESLAHCWQRHPRLCPEAAANLDVLEMDSQRRQAMEHGAAMHRLILGAGREIHWIDASDYRTKAAKEARDVAHQEGRTPVLTANQATLEAAAEATRRYAARNRVLEESLLAEGKAEQTMIWQERIGKRADLWCRALCDWMPLDPRLPVIDFKFTGQSAAPHEYSRTVADELGIRAIHYGRGLHHLRGRAAPYLYVVVEMRPPHAVAVFQPSEALLHLSREQWAEAAARWHSALRTGTHREAWPQWAAEVTPVEPNIWTARRWEDRKAIEGMKPPSDSTLRIKRSRPKGAMTEAQAEALRASLGGQPIQ